MKGLLRKLLTYSWIFPLGMSGFTTQYPESDGFIEFNDGKYMFCKISSMYMSEDSINDRRLNSVDYSIVLPGKVVDYHLYSSNPLIFFEDGSAMKISTWYLEWGRYWGFVLDNVAVRQYDKEMLTEYLENWLLRNQLSDMIEMSGLDPAEFIEPYESYYRANIYRKKLLEDIKSKDYNRLNFEIFYPSLIIRCFNVPISSFQDFIKSAGSLQILNLRKNKFANY